MKTEVSISTRRGSFVLDAHFALPESGVTALFGPSGAGKTSIVHAIAGLTRPRQGHIALNGRVVLDTSAGIDVPGNQRRVGCVFQDARLFPHMNVERNLMFGWRRARQRASPREIADIVDMLGIAALRARKTQNLSGGEKQRVAIGRALLSSPEVLLLDEPMASLDLARRNEIIPYLEKLRDQRKLPILLISHAIDEVARLADEVVVLNGGKVTLQGSVFEVMPQIDPRRGVVFSVRVVRHRDDGLSELEFAGGRLLVQRPFASPGATLRARIQAADIMISLREPVEVSANNVIAVRISNLEPVAEGLIDVALAAGTTTLIARITRASASRLALAAGTNAFAVIKAVTVDAAMKIGPDPASSVRSSRE